MKIRGKTKRYSINPILYKMKINQCKTQEEINEYFQDQDRKLWKDKYKFVYGEMDTIWAYCRDRQDLLDKCGDRLRKIKESEAKQ